MKKKKYKKRRSSVRINKREAKAYVKCRKCKRRYTIFTFHDRLDWWRKCGDRFVCIICDPEAKWYKTKKCRDINEKQ